MNFRNTLPILGWLPNYKKQDFKGDFTAGLTVGIMLVPQGMAYAMLAGLPPIYGLYAAMIPQLIYAVLGTSRQLSVGPVAMDSLLVAVAIGQFAAAETTQYISLAILLAFMVGIVHLLMGLLKLGFLVNLLSHPVISGFTSAAALIIGFSQLNHLLGISSSNSQYFHEIIGSLLKEIGNINPYTLAIGLTGILIIWGIQKAKSSIPAPLLVVVFGVAVVWIFGLDAYQVSIVKEVPNGLPIPALPIFDWTLIPALIPSALTIALVAFMEAISVAKAIHTRHNNYTIVPNQELIALGMANIVGSFFQGFPVAGGFSRSAVNDQAGAKTNLAAIISALFIMLTLLVLTPLFYYLPKAVLASIIMMAIFKLVSVEDAKNLWKKGHKRDFFILLITFLATLSIGIQLGIFIGVLLSIFKMLYDTMYPNIVFNKNQNNLPEGVLIVRFEEQLYFANSPYFIEKMNELLENLPATTQHLIFDATGIARFDSTGQKALDYFVSACEKKKVRLSLVGLPESMGYSEVSSVGEILKNIHFEKNKTV